MRWATAAMLLAGCLHSSEGKLCEQDGMSWVCPSALECVDPPNYCGTQMEADACKNASEHDPCSTTLVQDGQCIGGQCTECSNNISGCRYTGWQLMDISDLMYTGNLTAIVFVGPGEAYAGGLDANMIPVVLHYKTSRWDLDTRFDGSAFASQTITSLSVGGDKIYALVGNQTMYELDTATAGATWTQMPPLSNLYKSMWAADDGQVFLVGLGGASARFDGTSWSEPMITGSPSLAAVWGRSSSDVYAVGAASAIQHWDGSAWSPVMNPGTGNLTAVWGTATDVFVGGSTSYLHSTSGSFAAMPVAPIAPAQIWGSSPTDLFATGTNVSTGEVFHWDGISWSQFRLSTSPKLNGVSGSSATEVFAVGAGGTILRYTGNGWAEIAQPGVATLYNVWAPSSTELFASGTGGKLLHFTDPTWQTPYTMSMMSTMPGLAGRSSTDVMAVGNGISAHWNGSAWAETSAMPALNSALAVWGSGTTYASAGEYVSTNPGTATWTQVTSDAASYRAILVHVFEVLGRRPTRCESRRRRHRDDGPGRLVQRAVGPVRFGRVRCGRGHPALRRQRVDAAIDHVAGSADRRVGARIR
ncbi:MAG: hypothetical protein QM831_24125 [Kofleriaceae bacterium]